MGLPFWFCTSLHEFFPCCLPTSINLKHWVVCLCCWRFTGCTCSPSLQPVLPPVCVFRVCVMCLRTTTESKGGNRPVSYCSPTLTWYDSAPSLCVLFDALLCPHTPNYTDSTLALHTHTLSSCLNSQGLSHTGLDWLVTPGNHQCIPRHVGLWWLAFYWLKKKKRYMVLQRKPSHDCFGHLKIGLKVERSQKHDKLRTDEFV